MAQIAIADRIRRMSAVTQRIMEYMSRSRWAERQGEPGISDFVLGNPHDMPLPEFSAALQKWSAPQNQEWFAYKMSEPESQEIVARTLRESHAMPFDAQDILMTNGAFAAIAVTLGTITDPGDEIIYVSPPWFFYEAMILSNGGRAVRVTCDPDTFDLDLQAIATAITPQTRGIIINSPNNPTGRIYPPETLRGLAELLSTASEQHGQPIYLLSDESYHRIVFDGRAYPSPTAFYPHAFMLYTYGKTLLTPGQRLGYIALPPTMPDRETMRAALTLAQFITGYAFPNALLQHALPDIERLSIDVGRLQARRDHLVGALREMGYELAVPEGTFYLLVRSPLADEMAFMGLLADYDVFCLPGSLFEMPGYFRISLTANEDMIERALPGFAAAKEKAGR